MIEFITDNISVILIFLLTVIFAIATIIVNKSQGKLINKIDEQSIFLEQEKDISKRMSIAVQKRDVTIEKITILSMKINVAVVCMLGDGVKISDGVIRDLKETAKELEKDYKDICAVIDEINTEHKMLMNVTSAFKKHIKEINTRLQGQVELLDTIQKVGITALKKAAEK